MDDEEEFVDLLDERRRGSDLSFAFKTFSPWPYKGASSCSTADLNKAVLESHFLRHVAKEVQSPKPLEMFEVVAVINFGSFSALLLR